MYVCMYVCEYLGSSGGSHVEHQLNALHRGSVRQLNEEHRTLCMIVCMYVCMYTLMSGGPIGYWFDYVYMYVYSMYV